MDDRDRGRHDELAPDDDAGRIAFAPIGTVIGALAGAVGGWWARRDAADAGNALDEVDERTYREHYEGDPARPADRAYTDYRAGYWLGHLARRNPDYSGRRFEEIEPELEQGWSDELKRRYGDWAGMRGYARAAYERGDRGTRNAAGRTEGLQDPLPEETDR